jgi:biotin-(acetyl-CoA carboxylase) ligase
VNEDMTQSSIEELRTISTSIYTETKQFSSRELLLATICNELESILLLSMSEMLLIYTKYDLLLNQQVIVMPKKKEDTSSYFTATAIGLNNDGYLQIKKSDGSITTLVSEEVSIRLS